MINKSSFKLSIIIPCYNEKNTIKQIINKVIDSVKYYNITRYEIIVIDDCSNDGTREILNGLKSTLNLKILFNETNYGKGFAVKTALESVTGDIVLIQDADLEYDPYDYNKLLLPFFETNADVVYGSRFLGGGKYVRIHFFGIIWLIKF